MRGDEPGTGKSLLALQLQAPPWGRVLPSDVILPLFFARRARIQKPVRFLDLHTFEQQTAGF